jgi:pullulanase
MKQSLVISILATLLPVIAEAQTFKFDEVKYSPAATTFQLFAPSNASCKVVVSAGNKSKTVKMKSAGEDIWTATVSGNLKNQAYYFTVDGRRTVGVFAKAVDANAQHAYVVDMKDTDPLGWADDERPVCKSPADLVIYEMHHRDFSIDASSGIQHKGKFLALTEPKAVRYLSNLGVNAIHILPSFDFGSVDETKPDVPQYNWGYDPVNYNVPEGSYSTNANDPKVRIIEFKEMVQALHKAGIRVILDVVYNHTFDIKNSNFQKTYPDYYYRKVNGKYGNGSGCGNETASEKPMMRQFMLESVKYWINEYHIDGFRFDLMGVHDIETMNLIRQEVDKIDPTIFIYGEGWSAGSCGLPTDQLAVKANVKQMPGIAAFSDELRDALRGPFNDDHKGGFLAGVPGNEESIKFGIVGGIAHPQVDMTKVNYSKEAWANEPTQMITYVSCHDDMCLTDRLRSSIPGISTDELIKLDLLAQTAVFTSQGVPFMLSGEEMLRDKKGVHNSFSSPDSINHLDWNNLLTYPQVAEYYRNLLRLRGQHPAFRLGNADLVRKHLEFLPAPQQVVAYRLKNYAGRDSWRDIIVILNASKERQTVKIPQGFYRIVCSNGQIKLTMAGLGCFEGSEATVAPQSALIIHTGSKYLHIFD